MLTLSGMVSNETIHGEMRYLMNQKPILVRVTKPSLFRIIHQAQTKYQTEVTWSNDALLYTSLSEEPAILNTTDVGSPHESL